MAVGGASGLEENRWLRAVHAEHKSDQGYTLWATHNPWLVGGSLISSGLLV